MTSIVTHHVSDLYFIAEHMDWLKTFFFRTFGQKDLAEFTKYSISESDSMTFPMLMMNMFKIAKLRKVPFNSLGNKIQNSSTKKIILT